MLITDKLSITINSGFHIKYFKDKGFDGVKMGDKIEIDISLLPKGSHETIKAKCDYCGDIKELFYKEYNYSVKTNDKFCCSKCLSLKIEETCRKRYGKKSFTETDIFKEKSAKTCLKKYKVDRYCKTKKCVKQSKKTSINKYGVEHYSKTNEYKERCKKTSLENYGTEYPFQNEDLKKKLKNILLEKTGFEHALQNPESVEKSKKTSMKRYGVDCYAKTDKYKKRYKKTMLLKTSQEKNLSRIKLKKTCLLKYGVENPMQNIEIHEKQQLSAFYIKKYKNDLYYRGTYELDFLNKFYDKIEISKSKSITYIFENKQRRYHPDFYIKNLNLIVEIKSTYTYKYDIEKNEAKRKAALENGYNFIFIVDKQYDDFMTLIN